MCQPADIQNVENGALMKCDSQPVKIIPDLNL